MGYGFITQKADAPKTFSFGLINTTCNFIDTTLVFPEGVEILNCPQGFTGFSSKYFTSVKIPSTAKSSININNKVHTSMSFKTWSLQSAYIDSFDVLNNANIFFGTSSTLQEIITNRNGLTFGKYCFYKCTKLSNINFLNPIDSNSYIQLGQRAFAYTQLSNDIVNNLLTHYSVSSSSWTNNSNNGYVFEYCSNLTSLYSNRSIGRGFFQYCSGLTDVLIEHGPQTGNKLLYPESFQNCKSLQSLIINNVGNNCIFGASALANTTSLEQITLHNTIISEIGANCFLGSAIQEIQIMPNATLQPNCFNNSHIRTIDVLKSKDIITIGNHAFSYCNYLAEDTIIKLLTQGKIGQYVFANSSFTTAIHLNNISQLSEYAFYNCSNIISVSIDFLPDQVLDDIRVINVPRCCLSKCSDLQTAHFYTRITNYGNAGLAWCPSLYEVFLSSPEQITNVFIFNNSSSKSNHFLYECNNLSNLTLDSSWDLNFNLIPINTTKLTGENLYSGIIQKLNKTTYKREFNFGSHLSTLFQYYKDEYNNYENNNGINAIEYDIFSTELETNSIDDLTLDWFKTILKNTTGWNILGT